MQVRAVSVAGVAALIASMAAVGAALAPADAVPPGQNGKIAFEIQGSDGPFIHTINADGPPVAPIYLGHDPSWSPDSSRIAYWDDEGLDGGVDNFEIFTTRAEFHSADKVRLTNDPARDRDPAWSPHDNKIAFVSDRTGEDEIWVMNADGSSLVQLTPGREGLPNPLDPLVDGLPKPPDGFSASEPAWSPDGSKLVYTSTEEGDPSEIYTINADGYDLQKLTNNSDEDSSPSWSPDGTKIAFEKHVAESTLKGDVWAMNANGTSPINLTNHQGQDTSPAWSPDGTKIAFASVRAGGDPEGDDPEVFVMNANGTNPVTLTPGVKADAPDWGRKPLTLVPPEQPPTLVPPTFDPKNLSVKCWGKSPTIFGTAGNDTIVGTEGPDVIAGLGGKDTIRGLGGNDRICGTGKGIRIEGGDGDDRLQGSRGDDRLKGGDGDDRIEGGRGDDRLEGGDDNDHLGGGPDTDRIYGGSGKDKLYGGSGTYDLCKGGRGYDKASKGCQKKTGIQDDIDD